MANRVLEFTIKVKDGVTAGLKKIQAVTARLLKPVTVPVKFVISAAKTMFNQLTNIKSGIELVKGAFTSLANTIKKTILEAFKYETLEKQFAMLFNDINKAAEHVKMLRQLGDTPPFGLDEFGKASHQLHIFSDGVLNTRKMLMLVGDTAYKTRNSIDVVANAVGRAYSLIRDGEPFGRAGMMMRNMGILTPKVVSEIDKLQKSGADSTEIWNKFTEALSANNGAMDTCLDTGEGLIAAVDSQWTNAVREFGNAFMELAKTELAFVLTKLKEFIAKGEDGSSRIQKWAEKARKAIEPLVQMMMNLFDGESREITFKATGDYLKNLFIDIFDLLKSAGDYIAMKIEAAMKMSPWKKNELNSLADGIISNAAGVFKQKRDLNNREFSASMRTASEIRHQNAADREKAIREQDAAVTTEAEEQAIVDDLRNAELERQAIAEKRKNLEAEEKLYSEQIESLSQWGESLVDANNALVEKMNREADGLEKEAEKGITLADIDANESAKKKAKKRKQEEERYERILAQYRLQEKRDGGTHKMSARGREILEADNARKEKQKEAQEMRDTARRMKDISEGQFTEIQNQTVHLKTIVEETKETRRLLESNLELN